jgi:hypothetical protein
MSIVSQGIGIGIIATIVMDLWALIAKHVLRLPTADWALVGRWFGHLPRGVFVHPAIASSAPIKNELAIGWIAHYVTGIAYGLLYLGIIQGLLTREPDFTSALIFGLVTLVAPWLIMQPGMGAGVFATRTPRPNLVRLVNLSMHVVFGVGLYLAWQIIRSAGA